MAKGTVKWFNTEKGYGFIEPEGQQEDVFVHITAVQNSGLAGLNEGQSVEFELDFDDKGRQIATRVAMAGGTHGSGGGPDA